MSSLNKEQLDEIIYNSPFKGNSFQIFIETGTYRGDTIFAMEPMFNKLHTIEIKQEFYENCKTKYDGSKITFHLGDSSKILPQVLSEVQGDAIFFLDGHWSSKDTGRGEKDVPLFEELDAIHTLIPGRALIIIDDYRLFGRHPKSLLGLKHSNEDWSAINKRNLIARLKDRVLSSFVHGDRFIICIDSAKD
jgi:hypothetical protein